MPLPIGVGRSRSLRTHQPRKASSSSFKALDDQIGIATTKDRSGGKCWHLWLVA
jgi:hypothetical protein